jgi:hypothetical protein
MALITNKYKQLAVITFLFFLISSCEQTIVKPTVPFNPQEIENALKEGNSTITGQAFAKTQGGDVKYGAGNTINLIPLTPYVEQAINLSNKANAFTTVDIDKRMFDYAKKTTADGTGKFKFTDLSSGKYYLETDIKWQYQTQYGLQTTGGTVKGIANIENDGDTVEIILQ